MNPIDLLNDLSCCKTIGELRSVLDAAEAKIPEDMRDTAKVSLLFGEWGEANLSWGREPDSPKQSLLSRWGWI